MLDLYANNNPVVSVIMATFNRAALLNRSISSFINQTFKNAELIVVDDGSTDNSFEIVNQYLKLHDNIRYMKHRNRKLSLSKNVGIMASAGRYIAFLDSDDEYQPGYLENRVHFMDENPNLDLIQSGAEIIGDPYVKDKNDLSKKIHLSNCTIGPTIFGKKEVFIALDGFDKTIFYSEDSEFWERAKKKYSVKKIDLPGYVYYRDSEDSICNTI